jgi:hypothetical protein
VITRYRNRKIGFFHKLYCIEYCLVQDRQTRTKTDYCCCFCFCWPRSVPFYAWAGYYVAFFFVPIRRLNKQQACQVPTKNLLHLRKLGFFKEFHTRLSLSINLVTCFSPTGSMDATMAFARHATGWYLDRGCPAGWKIIRRKKIRPAVQVFFPVFETRGRDGK